MSRPSVCLLLALAALTAGGCALPTGKSVDTPKATASAIQRTGHVAPGDDATASREVAAAPPQPKWQELVHPPTPIPDSPFVDLPKLQPQSPVEVLSPAPREPLVLALECVRENRHQDALKYLEAYDPHSQEFLLGMLPILSLFTQKRAGELSPSEMAAVDVQLTSLQNIIRQHAELSIPRLAACESITGFGIYQPLSEDHTFVAAAGDRPGERVRLYVELRNLTGEPRRGLFETDMEASVEIADDNGVRKWRHQFRAEDVKLVSRLRLTEYYQSFGFHLPELAPGTYRLTVLMSDTTHPGAARSATASMPLRVVAGR